MKFDLRLVTAAVAVVLLVIVVAVFTGNEPVAAGNSKSLTVSGGKGQWTLNADQFGEVYRSSSPITNTRVINFPNSTSQAMTWTTDEGNFYAVSVDGSSIGRVNQFDGTMMLRYGTFDPLVEVPRTSRDLTARTSRANLERSYIVQFVTQPLDEYRTQLNELGAQIHHYVPNHAYLVTMNDTTRVSVANLPYVRWVGRYQPAYKLEEVLLDELRDPSSMRPTRYNIMALERGNAHQDEIGYLIESLGGTVDQKVYESYKMEATLTGEQLLAVAQNEKVLFIDKWSAPETDMDIVRGVGGANLIETLYGYRGQGVRAEVMDNGLRQTHGDFQVGGPPIVHNSPNTSESSNHGTSTYGINFGRGTANAAGRGMLPEATGIIADYDFLSNRPAHTAELLLPPYNAVYQSNSWGGALTTAYTTVSAEMDDILFNNDITILNSQSNTGNQQSRPQAWAKNVVSIGGIRHFNTASLTDDRWQSGASVGPAADGRVKPDLAHFYDSIFTTSNGSDTAYTTGFGGTSAATPITAGHFGIFFQMWHNGAFYNPTGATVFESRPKAATAKAIMINTAVQWDMNIAGTDITRVRQGWGRADLNNLDSLSRRMLVVDEADNLTNLQSKRYRIRSVTSAPRGPLKITLVYKDPMGTPGATRTRVNDLSLRVTAPDGTVYWGNVGIGVGGGMVSTPGGTSNIVDTVENVIIDNPMEGTWLIDIIASEIVADAVPSTPAIDATFSLVASGPVSVQ